MALLRLLRYTLFIKNKYTKPSQTKKGGKKILAAPKIVSFFTAGSREKDTIFCAARKIFDPTYFATALKVN